MSEFPPDRQTEMSPMQIRQILDEELHLFRLILKETDDYVGDLDRFSLTHLTELLQRRKQWIDELLLLETRRQVLNYHPLEDFKQEISDILHALITIDAQLMDFLKMRKQAVIKDLAQITDNKSRSPGGRSLKENMRIIDLVQE
jgi:hypothetical protein